MKNGFKIKQNRFKNKENEIVAYCDITVYIDGEYIRCKPVEPDKRVFNMVCKNNGFVVGKVDSAEDAPDRVIEVGE